MKATYDHREKSSLAGWEDEGRETKGHDGRDVIPQSLSRIRRKKQGTNNQFHVFVRVAHVRGKKRVFYTCCWHLDRFIRYYTKERHEWHDFCYP